jgi:hypothetical protein
MLGLGGALTFGPHLDFNLLTNLSQKQLTPIVSAPPPRSGQPAGLLICMPARPPACAMHMPQPARPTA